MAYTRPAVERVMKVQEAILRALSGRQSWLQVADVLGVSPRTVRRLRWRYEQYGYDGVVDHRRRRPSPRAGPVAEVQRVLRLYRERYGPRDGHSGFNIRHFYQVACRDHRVRLSYSFVKRALQTAGLVGKRRPRGRHRRRREPRPCFGELLHLDGSRHPWLALVADAQQTLIAVVDDATKQLLYAQLVAGGESLGAIMTALRAGPGPQRAGQRHAARASRQRAAGRRDPDPCRRESLSARALHPRLQRALCARPGRSQQCLCARGAAAGPRPDSLP